MVHDAPDQVSLALFKAANDPWSAGLLVAGLVLLGVALGWLSSSQSWSPRTRRTVLAGALVAVAALACREACFGPAVMDEYVHLHNAWLFGSGAMPYRDFADPYPFLWPLLCAPLVQRMTDPVAAVLVGRMVMLLVLAGTVALVWRTADRLKADAWAACVLLLCMSQFVEGAVRYRPDPVANLLMVAAVALVLACRPGLAGVMVGLGMLCTQKVCVYGAVLTVGALLGGVPPRDVARALGSGLAVWGLGLLGVAVAGVWPQYWVTVYAMSTTFVSIRMQSPGLLHSYAWLALVRQWRDLPLLPLLGIALVGGAWPAGRGRERVVLAVAGMALLAMVGLNLGLPHYVLFAACTAAIGLAIGVRWLEGTAGLWQRIPRGVVLLTAALSMLHAACQDTGRIGAEASRATLALIPPGGTIYLEGGPSFTRHPILRRDASYYMYYQALASEEFRQSGRPPLYYDPLDPPLQAHPPDCLMVEDPQRRAMWLSRLAAAGVHYREALPGAMVRVPEGP